jgi:hypothetical protein
MIVDAGTCDAHVTRYAFGDKGPSQFCWGPYRDDCDRFRSVPADFRFFDGVTEEEAKANAVSELGEGVSERLETVRTGAERIVQGCGVTPDEARANARKVVPDGALNIRTPVTRTRAKAKRGELVTWQASAEDVRNEWKSLRNVHNLPEDAQLDTVMELESGERGTIEFNAEAGKSWDWNVVKKTLSVPKNAIFVDTTETVLDAGSRGFLGFGKRPAKYKGDWYTPSKFKVNWSVPLWESCHFSMPWLVRANVKAAGGA